MRFSSRQQWRLTLQALDEMTRDGRLEQIKQRWLSDSIPR
jgi:ABC-type amino acid transport substrate-binding protein